MLKPSKWSFINTFTYPFHECPVSRCCVGQQNKTITGVQVCLQSMRQVHENIVIMQSETCPGGWLHRSYRLEESANVPRGEGRVAQRRWLFNN